MATNNLNYLLHPL